MCLCRLFFLSLSLEVYTDILHPSEYGVVFLWKRIDICTVYVPGKHLGLGKRRLGSKSCTGGKGELLWCMQLYSSLVQVSCPCYVQVARWSGADTSCRHLYEVGTESMGSEISHIY